MTEDSRRTYLSALEDFEAAHRKAAFDEILNRLSGRPLELVPYEEIRKRLRHLRTSPPRLEEIPINAIVGSVSRYSDFSRNFLPLRLSDRERWASVMNAQIDTVGLPPVELYQVGEVYFVLDGHHRISVSKNLGAEFIQANVTVIDALAPLKPGDSPDELILKTERSVFLEQTIIDQLLPGNGIVLTSPGKYEQLLEHIKVHQYFMGIDYSKDILMDEAVLDWYEKVFIPIVQVIKKSQLLRNFPKRTEADLYLWLAEHQKSLAEELGWDIPADAAARDLSEEFGRNPLRILKRQVNRVLKRLIPDALEQGPDIGSWRKDRLDVETEHIVHRILVAITGTKPGWEALNVAIEIAKKENSWIGGLYIVKEKSMIDSSRVEKIRTAFDQRCQDANVAGQLAVESGEIARIICARSHWTDLTVIRLSYPPPFRVLERLNSGLRLMIQKCPSPILVVRGNEFRVERAILAFDDSPKSREALYFATYLASRWKIQLTVVSSMKSIALAQKSSETAKVYLSGYGLDAQFVVSSGVPHDEIIKAAKPDKASLIVMGGYGRGPIWNLFSSSTVDLVLRKSKIPVLICR